ncbi:MAG: lysylphosphatidylglycerol synthase transmembrane domain-containing protein, partial [Solirubrobacteraceae bacterium]
MNATGGSGASSEVTESGPDRAEEAPPTYGDLKHKLVRGGIAVAVLVAVAAAVLALVPGLGTVRSAISGASPGWVLAGAGVQLVGICGAVVFVTLVFADVSGRLTWKMGGAQQAANAVLPTAGSTGVGYWTLSSIGWGLKRFAERTAVLIIAPAAPNVLLIIVLGLGMGLGLFAGPSDWWLTWLPAGIGIVVVVVAIWAARWGHRLAARTKRRWLREGLNVVATGVTGTVDVLRQRSWRVLGTWVDLFGAIGALWACLLAVGEHLPFAVVCMGFLIGQFAQAIPIPGGIGAIDAGVTGALVLYGGGTSISAAGEIISHGLAMI